MLEQIPDVPGERAVVPHVDDLGASHGANRAFLDLAARGLVTCGSVMAPGPWFREIAEAASADPALDLGVHLTLTSEWSLPLGADLDRQPGLRADRPRRLLLARRLQPPAPPCP